VLDRGAACTYKFDMADTFSFLCLALKIKQYWIWYPPFNTEFVRGKWAEGREVDTFHTFHWGETSGEGGGGAWEPLPERVGDVRQLLADSAVRQGISFPKSTH
jgi:hypothetical protein